MNNRIRTYEDLNFEKQRLLQLLATQEELIKVDIAGVKDKLKPVRKVARNIHKTFTRDNTAPLINFGLEMGVDVIVRRFILRRAGWFLRIVIPFFIKNYASHIIGEEKREALMKKVRSFFNKVSPEETPHAAQPQAAGAPPSS